MAKTQYGWMITYSDRNQSRGEEDSHRIFKTEKKAYKELAHAMTELMNEAKTDWAPEDIDEDLQELFDAFDDAMKKGDVLEAYEQYSDYVHEYDPDVRVEIEDVPIND